MALTADMNPNECYDLVGIIDNDHVLLLDNPLMVFTPDNIQDDHTIVLDSCSDENNFKQNLDFPGLLFDENYYTLNKMQGTLESEYEEFNNQETRKVDEGLAVLDILCNSNMSTPNNNEFIDIDSLTENDPLMLSDDDDDVIFVKEYKKNEDNHETIIESDKVEKNGNNIRRNPFRTVRTKLKDTSKELLFEEDFALLNISEEEMENGSDTKNSPTTFKDWPINAHERPEYNSLTKKIESFDYTIRDIQKKGPSNKKPRIKSVTVKRKSKKKYFTRQRSAHPIVEEKIFSLELLKPLVNSTTAMLRDFLKNHKYDNFTNMPKICTLETSLEILTNQALLFSLVNGFEQSNVLEEIQKLSIENETENLK